MAERYGTDWRRLSKSILERDGYRCRIGGPGCLGLATTTDHIVPISRGGTHHPSNLQAACRPCNSGKRDREAGGLGV